MKYRFIGAMFVCMVLVVVGCAAPTSTPTPTPVPPLEIPEAPLREIREDLGYLLVPGYIPEVFESCQVFHRGTVTSVEGPDVGEIVPQKPFASLIFTPGNSRVILEIRYPNEFGLEESSLEKAAGLKRPDDALSPIQINGRTGHLRRGFWSQETVRQAFDPSIAEWDYDYALSVYFDYLTPDGNEVEVAVVARVMMSGSPRPDWMTSEELIKIAESLRLASE